MQFVISEEAVGHPGTFCILFTLNLDKSFNVFFHILYSIQASIFRCKLYN